MSILLPQLSSYELQRAQYSLLLFQLRQHFSGWGWVGAAFFMATFFSIWLLGGPNWRQNGSCLFRASWSPDCRCFTNYYGRFDQRVYALQALCFKYVLYVLRRALAIARVKCHRGMLKTTRLAKLKSPAYAPAQHVVQTHILRNNMDISDMMSGDDVHESSF